jgi:MFS family permease
MGVSTAILGAVLASSGIARTAMFVFAGFFSGWQYRLWPLVAVQLGSAAGMLVVFWGAGAVLWGTGLTALGLGLGLTFYSSVLYSLEYSHSRRGLRAGIHESFVGSSMLLGPVCGGLVANMTGNLKSPWLMGAAIPFVASIASLTIYWIGAERLRRSLVPKTIAPQGAPSSCGQPSDGSPPRTET